MTRIVSNAVGVSDHNRGGYPREADGQPPAGEAAAAAEAVEQPDDVRLIIEGDGEGGGFTYITIDRRTGAVIRQLPREGLLQMGQAPDYAAGKLIKARA